MPYLTWQQSNFYQSTIALTCPNFVRTVALEKIVSNPQHGMKKTIEPNFQGLLRDKQLVDEHLHRHDSFVKFANVMFRLYCTVSPLRAVHDLKWFLSLLVERHQRRQKLLAAREMRLKACSSVNSFVNHVSACKMVPKSCGCVLVGGEGWAPLLSSFFLSMSMKQSYLSSRRVMRVFANSACDTLLCSSL